MSLIKEASLYNKNITTKPDEIITELLYRIITSEKYFLYCQPEKGLNLKDYLFSISFETQFFDLKKYLIELINNDLSELALINDISFNKETIENNDVIVLQFNLTEKNGENKKLELTFVKD